MRNSLNFSRRANMCHSSTDTHGTSLKALCCFCPALPGISSATSSPLALYDFSSFESPCFYQPCLRGRVSFSIWMPEEREDGKGGGKGKPAYQPFSTHTASQFFSSEPCSLGPGEVPNLMIKPTAHQKVCCAWPQGRPGISGIPCSSWSLALTLFFWVCNLPH